MARTTANGIEIEYDAHGDPAAPPVLLVMGLGAQMTLWPMELVEALVARGFRVIRYDNRDIGLSHKFDGVKAPGMIRLLLLGRFGFKPRVPYTLADMAADGIGLLDSLGIEKAHIVGASMGGMIAQHMAFSHPERVLTLTSIMSTTGNRRLPGGTREAIGAITRRPKSMDEDSLVEHGLKVSRAIGSPGYRLDEARVRERTRALIRRSFYPAGVPRQFAASGFDRSRLPPLSFTVRRTRWSRSRADRIPRRISPGRSSRRFPEWATTCRSNWSTRSPTPSRTMHVPPSPILPDGPKRVFAN